MAIALTTFSTLERELGTFYEAALEDLRREYVGNQIFPVFPVALQAGSYKVVPLEEMLRSDPVRVRAPGTAYPRSSTGLTQGSYQTYERGEEEPVDKRELAMYGSFIDGVELATMRLVHRIMSGQEQRIANVVMDATAYTNASLTTALGNGQWSSASSTPIADIRSAATSMFGSTGYYPDTLVINRKTFRVLQDHADIIARVTSSGAGDQARARDVTAAQLAAIFDIDRVVVAGGGKNTAVSGATPAISHIWPDHAIVCKTAKTQDIQEPCLGRLFHWAEDGSTPDGLIEVYYEPQSRSDIVRCRHDVQEQRIYIEMGRMILSVVA